MSAAPSSQRPGEATFDLTPMIDVVLLLIIFFMLSSQFARTEQPPMDLPAEAGESAEKQTAPSQTTVFIDMDARGELTAFGQPVDLDSLAATIAAAVKTSGGGASAAATSAPGPAPGADTGLDVVVRADRSCPATHLSRLADALARAGVRTWKLATNPDTSARPAAAPSGAAP